MTAIKVLVVDDEQAILRFISILLKHYGFEAITTTNGLDAITLIKDKQPDVVLLDILMPELSGHEVFERIRSFSQVPVIAFSANREALLKAVNMGFNDSISKPFDPQALVVKIESVVNGHHVM